MAYNPRQSIIDKMTSLGRPSDFESRKRLYESMGLQNTLGEYRGSDTQNPAFIRALEAQTSASVIPTPIAPTQVAQTISQPSAVSGQQQQLSSMLETLRGMQQQVSPAIKPPPMTAAEIAQKKQIELSVPQAVRDLIPSVPKVELTPDQILAEARKRPGAQFAEQEATQAKALLGPQAEAEKERVGQASAERGTAFSPRFFEQPRQAVDANKIAKSLNIDRQLAQIIASSMEQDQAERLKMETERNNQLINYYKTLGIAYNPLTGETKEIPEKEAKPASYKEWELAGSPGTYKDWAKKPAQQGLTEYQTQSRIDRIVSQYDNEPIVKNYNIIKEGYDFIKSIPSDTKNPADDIGVIYAFAKIMDPGSVVREGEYATVQKYAQAWAQSFGFNVARIFTNTKFLSTDAIKNMKATMASRYKASEKQFTNVEKEYNRRIKEAGAGETGSITGYGVSGGIPAGGGTTGGGSNPLGI